MTTIKKIPTVSNRIHPLVAGAAVSLTLLCLVASAAIAGWLPSSKGEANNNAVPMGASAAAAASQLASVPEAPIAAPVAAPVAAPAPSPTAQKPRVQRTAHAPQAAAPQAAAPQSPNYVGIGAGAVIGGLLGNQVGDGKGRTLATIAGAIGGGMIGNEIQNRQQR